MDDKVKEAEYLEEAKLYVDSVVDLEDGAKAIGWIGYGLSMRDAEVAILKEEIADLKK